MALAGAMLVIALPSTIAARDTAFRSIVAGSPTQNYPEVVAVGYRALSCGRTALTECSGVLIGPRTVLTAAHCVSSARPDELQVLFGPSDQQPSAVVGVDEVTLHPAYDPLSREGDLAALLLPAPSSVSPLSRWSGEPALLSSEVLLVGFGAESSDGTSGTKREGWAFVMSTTETTVRLTGTPASSCHGDSGGAMLLLDSAGKPELAGIIRSGGAGCSDFTVVTRVDYHAEFLDEAVARGTDAPVRPALDQLDLCIHRCDADVDCPTGFECDGAAESRHCVVSVLGHVEPGDNCTPELEQEGCVRWQAGQEPCRSVAPCPESGGGCRAGTGSQGGVAAWVLLVVIVCWRVRRVPHRTTGPFFPSEPLH